MISGYTADTLIDSTHGIKPIVDYIGQRVPVFCHDGKLITLSWMSDIVKVAENKKVYEVFLDNDKSFKISSNHKIMTRAGNMLSLKDIFIGYSIMPMYRFLRTTDGYWSLALTDGHNYPEAQLVAEWFIGRKITSDEVTHHMNEIKTDNRPENIAVMTRADHTRHHKTKENNTRWEDSITIEQVTELRNQGLTQQEIADKLGTTRDIIRTRLKYYNHKIIAVKEAGKADLYSCKVEKYNNLVLGVGVVIQS